jgi:hypothetical protein
MHFLPVALVVLLLSSPIATASPDPGLLLYATEGNRLRRFDVDTVGTASQLEDVLVEQASAAESGGGNDFIQGFRDSNGVGSRSPVHSAISSASRSPSLILNPFTEHPQRSA